MRVVVAVVITGGLIAGCKRSREKECDDLARIGTAFASELGKLGKDGKDLGQDPEIKASMAAFKQECLKWPQEVFDCMRANDETSPNCREAMSKVTGVVSTDVSKAPDGPAIVATAKLGDVDSDGLAVSLAPDGTLIAASTDWVTAVGADGKEKWRVTMKTKKWLVPLAEGAVLVADREQHDLAALDGATGQVRWRASLQRGEDDYSATEGGVALGAMVFVVLDEGRWLKIDPAACAKKAATCSSVAFQLGDEVFSEPELLATGDQIVVGESSGVRVFAQDGTVRASIRTRDTFGGMASLGGTRVAVTMDDELVLWDLAKCGVKPVVLPRKGGRMYIRGEGECEDCAAPPAGCLVARSPLSDVASMRPLVLADGSLAVQADGPGRVGADGTKKWVTEVDIVGPMRQVGDALVFFSRDDETKPAKAVALDLATGKARWQRVLTGVSSDVSFQTEPIVETAGPWLVVGAKGQVAWMKIK